MLFPNFSYRFAHDENEGSNSLIFPDYVSLSIKNSNFPVIKTRSLITEAGRRSKRHWLCKMALWKPYTSTYTWTKLFLIIQNTLTKINRSLLHVSQNLRHFLLDLLRSRVGFIKFSREFMVQLDLNFRPLQK